LVIKLGHVVDLHIMSLSRVDDGLGWARRQVALRWVGLGASGWASTVNTQSIVTVLVATYIMAQTTKV